MLTPFAAAPPCIQFSEEIAFSSIMYDNQAKISFPTLYFLRVDWVAVIFCISEL